MIDVDAGSAYSSLVAMHENWVVLLIQYNVEDARNRLVRDGTLLGTLHLDMNVLNAVHLHECLVPLWVVLVDQSARDILGHDRSQSHRGRLTRWFSGPTPSETRDHPPQDSHCGKCQLRHVRSCVGAPESLASSPS